MSEPNYNGGYPAQPPQAAAPRPADAKSIGYAVLGFFIPLIGLILFLVWKDQTPLRAKSAGKGALIGVIVYVVLVIIITVIGAIAAASLS